MRLATSILVVIGFTIVVVLGVLSVLADLLAMNIDQPPPLSDKDRQEDRESIRRCAALASKASGGGLDKV
jgi:hypothetical protein